MSYLRVIPRDLFNEAKLLKCLGALYIEAERKPEGTVVLEHDGGAFEITQDPSNGSIFVANVRVIVNGERVHVYTPLNSREPLPLCYDHDDETDYVFNDAGCLTQDFLAVGKKEVA